MRNPFRPSTSAHSGVACQIVRLEFGATPVVDLVTLEPCGRGAESVPAGMPVAIGLGSRPLGGARARFEAVLARWERTSAVLHLAMDDVARGVRCRFSDGKDELSLLLESPPKLS